MLVWIQQWDGTDDVHGQVGACRSHADEIDVLVLRDSLVSQHGTDVLV